MMVGRHLMKVSGKQLETWTSLKKQYSIISADLKWESSVLNESQTQLVCCCKVHSLCFTPLCMYCLWTRDKWSIKKKRWRERETGKFLISCFQTGTEPEILQSFSAAVAYVNVNVWVRASRAVMPDILVVLCYTNSKNIFVTIHYLHFMFFLHWLLCKVLRLNVDVIGFALHMPTFIYNYFCYKMNNMCGNSWF